VVPHGGADREGVLGVEVRAPVERARPLVEGVGVRGREAAQLEQDAHTDARPQTGLHPLIERAFERDTARLTLGRADAEVGQLAAERAFRPFGTGDEELRRDAILVLGSRPRGWWAQWTFARLAASTRA